MLTRPQVQRYAAESGIRDLAIVEKEVVLTYLLQLFMERRVLRKMAFKGGTCIRKMHLGSQGRFSTDLDFTGLEEHDHEDVILEMMDAFTQPFHDIQFDVPDGDYYETADGLSWGVTPSYTHPWNQGDAEIKIQVSCREVPTLAPEDLAQVEQSYFQHLPFTPAAIRCLTLSEIIAEKLRACYQRNKARDIYDLGIFATRPLNQPLIRRLVVLKLWQARDRFEPDRLLQKFRDGRDFDWDDLGQLVRRGTAADRNRITADCARGFAFLGEMTDEERALASDAYQRAHDVWTTLKASIPI